MTSKSGVASIHTATVNGHPLRFFRGPSGLPELPWHSVEDLQRCMALPREVRRRLLRDTQAGPFKSEIRAIATGDGIVVIAPHTVAQGLIAAMVEVGHIPANFENEYAKAGVAALNALTGDLPPFASFEWAIAAFRNTNGLSPAS